ncbi:FkbM family methyltransferase [Nostoc sp. FACHB-87]|uniref:FkbM family methyltransferase n=1 Tax=Nostocaceae TaxID=1162 RepID=UPI001684431A|nr:MULTISPECIES: FkbM family methyltransferase [Nostocaceae]MBD2455815.1 FkbM family methyltransferase [Nostoc sp. FACHB-87]MBD2477158.1 FkbM family methyltransferase [Anabaena sp. FACHB-83]
MQKLNLPNNLEIYYLGKEETEYIYQEIFIQQQYLQHGITINDGDCIFDIGANIGLFSIFLSKLYKSLKILAFEPIHPIFEVLQANINLHSLENISLQNYGLGSENISETAFTFYPNMSSNSTTRPWEKLEQREFMNLALNQDIVEYLFTSQEVTGEIKTLSSVINSLAIESIDLLKIDVEGDEYEVLQGINQDDWTKIKQIVLEVHDVEDRISQIKTLLESQNFQIIVEHNNLIPSTLKIFNLYAFKK